MGAERTHEIKSTLNCQRRAHYQLDASRIRNVKADRRAPCWCSA
jgi:hypothetical protein